MQALPASGPAKDRVAMAPFAASAWRRERIPGTTPRTGPYHAPARHRRTPPGPFETLPATRAGWWKAPGEEFSDTS